jgi:hypothetical protein
VASVDVVRMTHRRHLPHIGVLIVHHVATWVAAGGGCHLWALVVVGVPSVEGRGALIVDHYLLGVAVLGWVLLTILVSLVLPPSISRLLRLIFHCAFLSVLLFKAIRSVNLINLDVFVSEARSPSLSVNL